MPQNRRFLLKRRPDGEPVRDDFELTTEDTPALEEGQFLIRNHYASLDPAMRGWMDDAESYMPPIPLGAPVRASTIGRVAESRADGFEPGQWVMGLNAIEDYSVGQEGGFTQAIDADAVPEITNYLSLFGAVGMTAFLRPARGLRAEGGRDGAGHRRGRGGRLDRRAAGEDPGLPRGRDRRRAGEMRAADRALRLRRGDRLSRPRRGGADEWRSARPRPTGST